MNETNSVIDKIKDRIIQADKNVTIDQLDQLGFLARSAGIKAAVQATRPVSGAVRTTP